MTVEYKIRELEDDVLVLRRTVRELQQTVDKLKGRIEQLEVDEQ